MTARGRRDGAAAAVERERRALEHEATWSSQAGADLAWQRARREAAGLGEEVRRWAEGLAADPVDALRWGDTAVDHAHELRAWRGVLEHGLVAGAYDWGTLVAALAWLDGEHGRACRERGRSTSPMANLCAEAWRHALDVVRGQVASWVRTHRGAVAGAYLRSEAG